MPAATHTNRPYQIIPYDPHWAEKFQTHAATLHKIFGDTVVMLEHIGSTAIPGMWAKPQIDIVMTVKEFENVPTYYEAMQHAGYTPRGDWTGQMGEEYFTYDTSDGIREASIHVLPIGHKWATQLVDFRDYLLTHPDDLRRYADMKKELHQKHPSDYTSYYKGKVELVEELLDKAAAWRHRS